jgi:hypothetical protein
MFNALPEASCCVPWFIPLLGRVFGMNIYTALCLGYKASFINLMQKIRLDLVMYAMKFKMREILAFKESFDLTDR